MMGEGWYFEVDGKLLNNFDDEEENVAFIVTDCINNVCSGCLVQWLGALAAV